MANLSATRVLAPRVYVCEDGHTWIDQRDGTVSPSYGAGGTHHHWKGYDPLTCPEPKRHESDHGYVCPSCKAHWFMGSCGCSRWRPPKPFCKKPPLFVFEWRDGTRKTSGGWFEITVRQIDLLEPVERFEQVADALRFLKVGIYS